MARVLSKRRDKCGLNEINLSLFNPGSDWGPPRTFPDLRGEHTIGIDAETKDPHLSERGPGFIRGDAEVVGVSVATNTCSWYFPFGHLMGGNLDRGAVIEWLHDQLQDDERYIIGAHLQYELEALNSLGIRVRGRLIDVQLAEALIDEESASGYSLESLCQKYLKCGKDESLLREAASAYQVDPKAGLWKLHSKYVGPYAEFDASSVIKIFREQLKVMESEDLLRIFELESKLLPILWKMRLQGIPVDLDRAREVSGKFKVSEDEARDELREFLGWHVDEWSSKHLQKICEQYKISYPMTPRGNPSFEGDWLQSSTDPMLKLVGKVREYNRLRKTFIDDWIFRNQICGKIHPQWKQLISDDGGTRTGRMAASNPNPQQVPGRSDQANLIRSIFVAEAGKRWAKVDYSQQEPRLLIHYACLCGCAGAELVRLSYQQNPEMDIYQFLAESCNLSRRDAKDATLGRVYGMGAAKFARNSGIALEAASAQLRKFDEQAPFVREMADFCTRKAQERGYIRTIGGRRRHFNLYEPQDSYQRRKSGEDTTPRTLSDAQTMWPSVKLQRSLTHKALNALIQGSAADMTKCAIVKLHEDMGIVPYMAIHDEIGAGIFPDQANELKSCMESAVELKVPVVADMHIGDHWK